MAGLLPGRGDSRGSCPHPPAPHVVLTPWPPVRCVVLTPWLPVRCMVLTPWPPVRCMVLTPCPLSVPERGDVLSSPSPEGRGGQGARTSTGPSAPARGQL